MNLKQIIFINKNKFVCQLVEKLCKHEGISCYTLSQNENFSYLINDLLPEAIIVAQETFDSFGEDILKFIQVSEHKSSLILMSSAPEVASHFDAKMGEELNPQTFLQDVRNLLGEHSKKH